MHWATPFIGAPWAPAPADAPRSFFCWSLVQHALRAGYGVAMPDLPLGEDEPSGVVAVKQAASGWQQVDGDPQDGDIMLLLTTEGRHVGLVIDVVARLMLLHADGRMIDGRPHGSVKAQRLNDVAASGRYLGRPELWRRR